MAGCLLRSPLVKLDTPDATRFEIWETDEPSRGIEGEERMRLIRDEIKPRVQKLNAERSAKDPTDVSPITGCGKLEPWTLNG